MSVEALVANKDIIEYAIGAPPQAMKLIHSSVYGPLHQSENGSNDTSGKSIIHSVRHEPPFPIDVNIRK